MTRRIAILLCAGLTLAQSCSDATSPSDELSGARHRWEAWGPTSYDLVVRRGSCECLPESTAKILVAVRDGAISRYNLDTGQPITREFLAYPAVAGFFELIASEIANGRTVEVAYDPLTGAPLEIDVDRELWPLDGGYSLTIVFHPATPAPP